MTAGKYYLKFYGDDATRSNYLFTFQVANESDARQGVRRFRSLGIKIRSAYFCYVSPAGVLQSHRLEV
jgi:hypothetical protein